MRKARLARILCVIALVVVTCKQADPDPIPLAPSDLVARTMSTSSIRLSWKASPPTRSQFQLERKFGGGEFTVLSGLLQDTVYLDSGLLDLANYRYRVVAVNSSGSSGASNEAGIRKCRLIRYREYSTFYRCSYNDAGQLVQITTESGATMKTYEYDSNGDMVKVTKGNGLLVGHYNYDSQHRVMTATIPNDWYSYYGPLLFSRYYYNASNQLTSRIDSSVCTPPNCSKTWVRSSNYTYRNSSTSNPYQVFTQTNDNQVFKTYRDYDNFFPPANLNLEEPPIALNNVIRVYSKALEPGPAIAISYNSDGYPVLYGNGYTYEYDCK